MLCVCFVLYNDVATVMVISAKTVLQLCSTVGNAILHGMLIWQTELT